MQSPKGNKLINHVQIGFININHLYPKVDQLRYLMNDNDVDFNVFAVNETFLNESFSDCEISILGYTVLRRDRVSKAGGGVAVYIKDNLPFIRRTEFENVKASHPQ